jgi:hypothetical protein
VPLTELTFVVNGALDSTDLSPVVNQTCDQTSSQANSTTTDTNSSNTFTRSMHSGDRHTFWRGPDGWHQAEEGAAPGNSGPSGFNGDSILNLSNNQLPSQVCDAAIPVSLLGSESPVSIVTAVVNTATGGSSTLNSSTLSPVITQGCTQTSDQANDTTTNTGSNNTHS